MAKPTKILVDCSTGVTSEVELTDQEIAEAETSAAAFAAQRAKELAEEEAAAQAKVSALAKLAALGLTEDEAKALVR